MENKQTEIKKEQWWSFSIEDISQKLKTDIKSGLTTSEAEARLKQLGPNQLPEQKKFSILGLLLSQFSNFIVWVLIGTLIVAGILGEWADSLSIGLIVVFNTIVGFVQEYGAERSLEALRELTKPESKVIRDGKTMIIPSTKIVQGDLVLIEAGDQVPADGRIVDAAQLATQEAALTGESLPINKISTQLENAQIPIGDRKNMVFMGTAVTKGKGCILITETAIGSELGNIASMLKETTKEETPLHRKLTKLGHQLLGICLGIVIVIFILGLWRKSGIIEMLLTSMSLAVAAIPEGLPTIITIALAIGVRKLAKQKTLIRRLLSVETLGCTTVICSDKTGTLTQNEMTVKSVWVNEKFISISGSGYTPEGDFEADNNKINPQENNELFFALKISTLCNGAELKESDNTWSIIGDPTEGALLTAAKKAGLDKKELENQMPLLKELPFDSDRKRMSILRKTEANSTVFVKGAPDVIVGLSEMILLNGKTEPLTEEKKQQIASAKDQLADQALRILALAYKDVSSNDLPDEELEKNLVFVGLIAMIDPPRPEAKVAIETCKKAGIKAVMITGDYKKTAIAIAQELSLMEENKIAISGEELAAMDDTALKNNIDKIAVYARTSAQDKIRIIKAWKSHGEIVAMTGDGVNDAPAIKAADIGISMGISGTEVTKQASDMVITDDNFATIVKAVEEGRGIYDNIIKFVNYLLSSNIAELLVIFIGILFGFTDPQGRPFICLLPVQLLWMNLVTDGFPAIALAVDPITPDSMNRPPRNPAQPILPFRFLIRLALIGFIIAIGSIIACHFALKISAVHAHTMVFTTLILSQFVRIQMIRANYHIGFFSNNWLTASLVVSFFLQLMVIYIPIFQKFFKTTALGLMDWGIIITIMFFIWLLGMSVHYAFSKWLPDKGTYVKN